MNFTFPDVLSFMTSFKIIFVDDNIEKKRISLVKKNEKVTQTAPWIFAKNGVATTIHKETRCRRSICQKWQSILRELGNSRWRTSISDLVIRKNRIESDKKPDFDGSGVAVTKYKGRKRTEIAQRRNEIPRWQSVLFYELGKTVAVKPFLPPPSPSTATAFIIFPFAESERENIECGRGVFD